MRKLENLKPNRVFHYFEDLCNIPHGSGNTKAISDYCVAFAAEHGLECVQDALNDVIIRKPASAGYENHPTTIIQGHLDMVCEKDPDCSIDFEKDGLDLVTDGEWVRAKGTTLGGDDCIAVAMAMAVLEDDTLPHPALEAVFTVDEETGMYGARALDYSLLKGKILLNADSEEEGIFTVGCAGGARVEGDLPYRPAPAEKGKAIRILADGMIGGHSGAEIHRGRLNANHVLADFLATLGDDLRIVSMGGGNKDNAIPCRAQAVVLTDADVKGAAAEFVEKNKTPKDPGMKITVTEEPFEGNAYTKEDSAKIVNFVRTLPNGVQAMSKNIPGLVETSLNLGRLICDGDGPRAILSVRSSVEAEKTALIAKLEKIITDYDGVCETRGHYPPWEYREVSPLRDLLVRLYKEDYGKEPVVGAIHAGLECGYFTEQIPGLDAVSFGPSIHDIHTPREALNVASVERTYKFLCHVLAQL